MRQVSPLAHQLQNLTPDLANDGPNTEYPWPHQTPTHCPAMHSFDLWGKLRDTGLKTKSIKDLGETLEPGKAAVVALVDHASVHATERALTRSIAGLFVISAVVSLLTYR